MKKYQDSSQDEEWSEHYDENASAYYYYNNITGISTWNKPDNFNQLPPLEVKRKPSIKNKAKSNSRIIPINDNSDLGHNQIHGHDDDHDHNQNTISIANNNNNNSNNNQKSSSEQQYNNHDESSPQAPLQDYLGLAKIYKFQKPYRDYSSNITCVLCHNNNPTSVLYPCQHRCICDLCIKSEGICPLEDMGQNLNGFCNCPLCGTVLKKILPAENGHDEEVYWNWVLEVKPPLPDDFMANFRHSAAIIQKVHIDENIRLKQQQQSNNKCCLIS